MIGTFSLLNNDVFNISHLSGSLLIVFLIHLVPGLEVVDSIGLLQHVHFFVCSRGEVLVVGGAWYVGLARLDHIWLIYVP